MNTIKNNRLIAEFMGVEHTLIDSKTKKPFYVNLRYHNSWDELMPVVVRCFNKYDEVEDNLSNHQFILNDALLETNIASLYDAVVGFIKWYNKNK